MIDPAQLPLVFSSSNWNKLITQLPTSHLLQTWQWGKFKSLYSWKPVGIIWSQTQPGKWQMRVGEFQHTPSEIPQMKDTGNRGYANRPDALLNDESISAAAIILQRNLSLGRLATPLNVMYAPKGPLLDWGNGPLRRKVLTDLQTLARHNGAIFIKIDPDVRLGEGVPGRPDSREDPTGQQVTADLHERGWRFSQEQIQFRNTVLIDLTLSEEQLLAQMKQKTRYNIRLAERRGVTVRTGTHEDWAMLYRMYAITSIRDGFVIRDVTYYQSLWEIYSANTGEPDPQQPIMESLIAEVSGEPVAAVVIYRFAGNAWYLSGMSLDTHREKMPNYLLQWEAIRRAKAAGCKIYDLWGAPEQFSEHDSLWGVFRFKEGLGGKVLRTLGAWDYPARSMLYAGYTQLLPRLLNIMRRRGKARTRQNVLGT